MTTDNPIVNFIERLGVVAQADGLPRIAGRIMAYLIVYDGPASFSQLAESLQVSRGSISTNTRLLVQLGVIERTSLTGQRQDYFRIRPEPYQDLIRTSIARTRSALEVVETACVELPSDLLGARRRLRQLNQFYQLLLEQHEAVLKVLAVSPEDGSET